MDASANNPRRIADCAGDSPHYSGEFDAGAGRDSGSSAPGKPERDTACNMMRAGHHQDARKTPFGAGTPYRTGTV